MDIGEKRIGKNRKKRVEEKDLKEADHLTMMIQELEESPEQNKSKLIELKTKRHNIMKKNHMKF